MEDHHSFVSSDRLAGTGDWLFKKPEFIEWEKSNSSSILWLHGIGKNLSVLNSPCVWTYSDLQKLERASLNLREFLNPKLSTGVN